MEMTDKQKEGNDKWSGTVKLEIDEIVFTHKGKELLRFPLSEIKVIGEMTTIADPMANDWYFVFVTKDNKEYFMPAYANNMESFQKQLGDKLETYIIGTLFASVVINSNIIYPKVLAGQKLFEFNNVEPKNVWEKIERLLGFGKRITSELTEEVKKYNN